MQRRMFNRPVMRLGAGTKFNGNVANLKEDVGENGSAEVSSAVFTAEGGKSNRLWQITPENVDDLIDAFPTILGTCDYEATGTGRLARTLPLADPLYAWLYASGINHVEGYGKYNKVNADPTLEAPGFPAGTFWDQYRLSVDSAQRPFPILPDYSINTRTGTWYVETGAGTTAATYTVADEQNRYCTWNLEPQNDYITQQRGAMVFDSGDVANGKSFQAMPKIYLPNSLYTVTWYYVPVRLLISAKSYLQRWRGRINQNLMYGPDGMAFNPGELLYLNFAQKMFTPPVQNLVSLGGEGGSIISTEKFAHITLTFLHTVRTNASAGSTPTNKNFVANGHNLLPWSDGGFRYAKCSTGNNRPTWLSAPLETLFTDCDSPGGVV